MEEVLIVSLEKKYLPMVVDIHLNEWLPTEMSVKLGRGFVSAFFDEIIKSNDAICFVALYENKPVAYLSAFNNYSGFNKRFLYNHFFEIGFSYLKAFLSGKVKLCDLLTLASDENKLSSVTEPNNHIGAMAIQSAFLLSRIERNLMGRLLKKGHDFLLQSKARFVWICSAVNNQPSLRFFLRNGYEKVGEFQYGDRQLWVLQIDLNKNYSFK